ncbi:MAG: hypothetical protein LBD79_01840 [Treponema sp.]|jgi:hypothetical protein|nr:hypothetical protein [Treponema sp.]
MNTALPYLLFPCVFVFSSLQGLSARLGKALEQEMSFIITCRLAQRGDMETAENSPDERYFGLTLTWFGAPCYIVAQNHTVS